METSAKTTSTGAGRRTVASYPSYRQAERAVDKLSDEGVAVEHVAIVGSGLRSVEQVSGRMTAGRAALIGAGEGAMIGLLFALLFGLFFDGPNFAGLVLYSMVVGAVFGATFGALAHGIESGGDRDFVSTSSIEAERYDVQADEAAAEDARRSLAGPSPEGNGSPRP